MRFPIAGPRSLHARGVLGINSRNGRLVLPLNPRHLYPRVDDKLYTKRLAEAAGIATPRLLGSVSHHYELRLLPDMLLGLDDFVLKPAHGAQGNGIIVIVGKNGDRYRKSSGSELRYARLQQHVSSVISGVFSLRGDWDACMIEERIIIEPSFDKISRFGIPDIRVIVYRGLPVMAMSRLPTSESDGRANLHQGAIAAGIDMATGRAIHAAHHNRTVTHHVDTGHEIVGFQIPHWDELLSIAVRAADITGLGYLGVDIVVDARRGPLLLELNARPGLAIQIANNEGLQPRLRLADTVLAAARLPDSERCEITRKLFASSPA
jgi:alpha-L-glutamate ligase-like protein